MPVVLSVLGIACLVAAATCDVRGRGIPNALSLGLVLLGLVRLGSAVLVRDAGLGPVLGDLAASFAMFCAGAGLFAAGALGGGDVKLLAAASLWLGLAHIPAFLMATALAGGVLALAKLVERRIGVGGPGTESLPYGLAIALGGIVAATFAA